MPLLRVSEFCRRTAPSKVPAVAVEVSTNGSGGTDASSIGYVSLDVLVSVSLPEDSLAFLCHGSAKVILRLRLLEEENEEESKALIVRIAPIVATNLGIQRHGSISDCWLEGTYDPPSLAEHVVLRPLGRPPRWPRFRNWDVEDHSWIFPPSNILLQPDHLLSVYDSSKNSDSVFYYEVLEIQSKKESAEPCLFRTTSSTTFELDQAPLASKVRRLPPLCSQQHIYQSATKRLVIPPHPNVPELIHALCQPPTLGPNECILHVIGTDSDHHVRIAVETAAHQVGLQCWSLRGLAAFAHAHHHQGQHTVRTGSLVDQLAGLQAALDEIRQTRMEPCVLHLYDFDQELNTTDEPLRHEQEERFWAKWIEALVANMTTRTPMTEKDNNHRYTSPLIIVISTNAPLKPGPLLEKLVFPSINLTTPDLRFIKYLWKDDEMDDHTANLLQGRSAREIQWLRQQHEETELAQLCAELDANRRQQSSASVSNVHWDDVGGLAHVRREIMDAIELPLKHPHLFPKTGGRSGILLYGPPGTGKTLVAKAVATECGLPFLSVKGPELLGSYVGESEANVRTIFQSARDAAAQNTPTTASILFFDELDSLAPRRGGVGDGGGVMERVVATLFAELDGDASAGEGRVFVMGATNRPDLLDPSLLRPGRLDRLVYLGIPTDDHERARVLTAQLHKLRLEGEAFELAQAVVANLPPRLTGADMSTIASGALLFAVQGLCKQADEEKRITEERDGSLVTLDQILEGWDLSKRTPIVRLEDLLEASKEVVPSVTQAELERYERLRDQYSSKDEGPIELEGDFFY
jgi:SpoVK/Ycf46/Vps4 family AAA+-type ATPase